MEPLSTRYLPLEIARKKDTSDPLSAFRSAFFLPQHDGQDAVYLTGNSLGLQPKSASAALQTELDDWKRLGVEGHFAAQNPWMPYHERTTDSLARLAGALPSEVVAMGSLTANLHFLMASFYRPTGSRRKILTEAKAFPSDRYALASQIQWHGGNPDTDLIEIAPNGPGGTHRVEDFEAALEAHGSEIALFLVGGVNYFTGQVFPMERLTAQAQAQGAVVGWDLAHAMGNVPLELHRWNVDFAAWCSYKYLNSSPGGVAGIFVHERHHGAETLRLAGWWGQNKSRRFLMEPEFHPIPTAESWQLSNAPVLSLAVHRASLDLFDQADAQHPGARRAKSLALSADLMGLLDHVRGATGAAIEVFTPREDDQRGSQVSVRFPGRGKAFFDALTARGVIADWREPDCIRMAPVPLYNSFEDLSRLESILLDLLTP
jgi:kynureninase